MFAVLAWKPAVVQGRVEPREIVHLTVVFDHDVLDGAPAARFTRRLVELIASGSGFYKLGRKARHDHRRSPQPPWGVDIRVPRGLMTASSRFLRTNVVG
jgi:hypothetical protein